MVWPLLAVSALAIALAWPVPLLLGRSRWTKRSPHAALVLWQAIALGGALSMFGALLAIGLWPHTSLVDISEAFGAGTVPNGWTMWNALAFSTALLFALLLCANAIHAAWNTERKRRQHRSRIDLLSAPFDDGANIRLLNHPAPLAFCLPGMRNVTVLSSGLVELFDESEFRAVVAHERAHLRGQHHVLLLAFRAWHDALPWFPIASRAEGAVAELIELAADDDATRTVDRAALASALSRIGGAWDDGLSFGQDGGYATRSTYADRLARLEVARNRISPAARWFVLGTSMLIVGFPAVFLALTLTGTW